MKFIHKFNESISKGIEEDINNVLHDLRDLGYNINISTLWVSKGYDVKGRYATQGQLARVSTVQFANALKHFQIRSKGYFNLDEFDVLTEHISVAQTCFDRLSDIGKVQYQVFINNRPNGDEYDDENYDDDGDPIEDENDYNPDFTPVEFIFFLTSNIEATRDIKKTMMSIISPYMKKNGIKFPKNIGNTGNDIYLQISDPIKPEPYSYKIKMPSLMKNKKVPTETEEFIKKAENIYSDINKLVSEYNLKSSKGVKYSVDLNPWMSHLAQPHNGMLRIMGKFSDEINFVSY